MHSILSTSRWLPSLRRMLVFGLVLMAIGWSGRARGEQWIWNSKEAATKAPAGECFFRKVVVVAKPESGRVEITADNRYELFVNGRLVGSGGNWNLRTRFDISPLLVPGPNVIAIRAMNDAEGPAGLAAKFILKSAGREAETIGTDKSWKVTLKVPGGWTRLEGDDSQWPAATELGPVGSTAPWNANFQLVDAQANLPSKSRVVERGLPQLRDEDRVVFLGSAFVERMQTDGTFEFALTTSFPRRNVTFRNLGWSGDNVWGDARAVFGSRTDGFKRLMQDTTLCQPTLIVLCYGENEAYEGEAGLETFASGVNDLLAALEKTGARLVLVGPRDHENVGPPFPDPAAYNAALAKYRDVIRRVALDREHAYVDASVLRRGERLTANGMHLTPRGAWALADDLGTLLGGERWKWQVDVDVSQASFGADGTAVSELKTSTRECSFIALDRRLQPAALPKELSEPGAAVPLAKKLLRVRSLESGKYQLKINGQPSGTPRSHEEWRAGVEFVDLGQAQTSQELLAAIGEKNFLFFNRYRPQNETYLFLFRKHEQGNNAVEIPAFDPLVAAQEKAIQELRLPKAAQYQLVKTE